MLFLKQALYVLYIGGVWLLQPALEHAHNHSDLTLLLPASLCIYQDQSKKVPLPHQRSQSNPLNEAGMLWSLTVCFIKRIFGLTSSRPYRAARSKGVSWRLFLMVGSVSSWSNTETTSECPYWAAQWRAVSFSWFCGRIKGGSEWQQEGSSGGGSNGNLLQPSGFFLQQVHLLDSLLLWNVPESIVMVLIWQGTGFPGGPRQEQCWWSSGPRLALDQW